TAVGPRRRRDPPRLREAAMDISPAALRPRGGVAILPRAGTRLRGDFSGLPDHARRRRGSDSGTRASGAAAGASHRKPRRRLDGGIDRQRFLAPRHTRQRRPLFLASLVGGDAGREYGSRRARGKNPPPHREPTVLPVVRLAGRLGRNAAVGFSPSPREISSAAKR